MRVVADEGVERQIVDGLRNEGHSVWYVAEKTPSASDDFVLSMAREQDALLARVFHRVPTAAAQSGMSTALRL